MNLFRTYLQSHLDVSATDWQIIEQTIIDGSCRKGELLTAENEIEKRVYFLMEGVVRLYFEAEEKDITINFGFPDSFISSYTSFLNATPSKFIIEALTDCKFIYLTKEDIENMYVQTSCGQALGRIFAENMFLYLSKRENDFMMKSPTERYTDLFIEQTLLVQEIPQKYLASYIGITPQALSRIRAKLSSSDFH